MKRKLLYTITAISIILLGLLFYCGVIFLRSARHGEAVLESAVKKFENTPQLGKLFYLETTCLLPWGQTIDNAVLQPGEGLFLPMDIKISDQKYTAAGRRKVISIPLKSYRTGKLEPGTVQVTIERNLHNSPLKKQTLSIKLPAVEIAPLKTTDPDQLPLAGEALAKKPEKNYAKYFIIAGVVLLLSAAVVIIWRRKYRKKQADILLPPWVIARRNLAELRQTANANKQPLEWCVAKLTDVVREYLSIRFNWRVKQQTTEEFFLSLKRKSSPLTEAQTFYLEEFMKQSDLVKFANIKPDKEAFAQAVNRAEELVDQTGEPGINPGKSTDNEVKK